MTDWKSALRADPTAWLLDNACPAIRYRVLREILAVPVDDPRIVAVRKEALAAPGLLKAARNQRVDGNWAGAIHVGDAARPAASTELTLLLLSEYGADRNHPAIKKAVKLLKTFLAARRDLKLYEFQKQVKADIMRERYYRWFLRIVALGLVQRTGPEQDGRVMDSVLDLLDRVAGFVNNPISRNPLDRIGGKMAAIRPEAMSEGYAFIPDWYVTQVFAHTPRLLESEILKVKLKKIYDYVLSEPYQAHAPTIGLVKTARGSFAKGWGLELRPIEFYLKNDNLDSLLRMLESFARLGLVNRYPLLMSHVEWLLGQQERDGRWNLPLKHFNSTSLWTRSMRLEQDWRGPVRASADQTFRILLILRLQWERQIRMLDRGEDAYPV
jgi:hypothetical protein